MVDISKHKLYCLMGRSCSGKTTIQNLLCNEGFVRVVSHTTRPKRESERSGFDYFFVDYETATKDIQSDKCLEHAVYNNWLYYIHKDSIDLENGSHICVVEPSGFKQIQDKLGKDNVIGIYLYLTDYWELLKRSVDRQPHATVDQCKEMCRRFLSDFDTFKEAEKLCILKINNINSSDTIDIILRNIKNGSI